ncbi:LysR family transcriptional regulator [Desertihabitans aurantiacus]|uniref:LysR family transcriptional regulator n=1 Tax=Desertihabitans aurantiacus TaxID=2282477 RepID=UPI000DF78CD2|nr:LysR family transcriptional regulator [Desertihabitans aurantiacus]
MLADEPDLVTLRLLRLLADHESLGTAAAALGMSQQAASARLRRQERRLGRVLATRTRTGSRLTEDGVLVLEWARPLLEAADRFAVAMAALDHSGEPVVEVAASQTVSEELLPQWLTTLRTTPVGAGAGVRLLSGNSSFVLDHVRHHPGSLGFVETPDVPDDLSTATVGHDDLVLVVAPTHPWASRGRPVTAALLARTPLVSRESGSGTRRTLERALASLDPPLRPVPPAAELTSSTGIRAAVASGLAPAVISRTSVAVDLQASRLVLVPCRLPLRRPLTAVWRGRPGEEARLLLAIAQRQPAPGFAPERPAVR